MTYGGHRGPAFRLVTCAGRGCDYAGMTNTPSHWFWWEHGRYWCSKECHKENP